MLWGEKEAKEEEAKKEKKMGNLKAAFEWNAKELFLWKLDCRCILASFYFFQRGVFTVSIRHCLHSSLLWDCNYTPMNLLLLLVINVKMSPQGCWLHAPLCPFKGFNELLSGVRRVVTPSHSRDSIVQYIKSTLLDVKVLQVFSFLF